uniref:Uncharacterized protein TCIL3000_4_900 n=1 Tax=Trypanosoma congolense (strain IL3000) TaxID=1068625 RepID=G0UKV1_TRYCI|nr:unnamed protein product [Trypanosoma congolense IL3000]
MLKLLSQRLRLAATIAFKRSGGGTKVEEAFNGLIKPRYSGEVYPIGHTNVAEVRVWLKIVDFCTTKEGKAYPYCRDKKPIFDRSKVSHAVFFLASDGEAADENPSGKEDEGPGNQDETAEGTPEDSDSGRHGEATEATNETREETISPGEGDEDAQEGTDAYDPNGSGWVSDEEEETGAEGDPEDEERGGGDNEDHHGETKGTKEKGAQGFRFWNDWGPLRIPIAAVGAVDMVLLFFNSLLFTVYWFGMR